MESLLAGLIAGAAMGLVATAFVASIAVESPRLAQSLRNRVSQRTPLPTLTVAAALAGQGAWALLGLLFGGVYWAIRDDAQSGAGSPAWGYTLAIVLLALLLLAMARLARARAPRRLTVLALLGVASFGWLLPHLAEA